MIQSLKNGDCLNVALHGGGGGRDQRGEGKHCSRVAMHGSHLSTPKNCSYLKKACKVLNVISCIGLIVDKTKVMTETSVQ